MLDRGKGRFRRWAVLSIGYLREENLFYFNFYTLLPFVLIFFVQRQKMFRFTQKKRLDKTLFICMVKRCMLVYLIFVSILNYSPVTSRQHFKSYDPHLTLSGGYCCCLYINKCWTLRRFYISKKKSTVRLNCCGMGRLLRRLFIIYRFRIIID